MAQPSDLVTLAAAQEWLGSDGGDPSLATMISGVSRAIYSYLGRPALLPASYSEVFDGDGHRTRFLREWPVNAVSALLINGQTFPAAPPLTTPGSSIQRGYILDAQIGNPPGIQQRVTLRQGIFAAGIQNCAVTYSAGYQISSEAQTIDGENLVQADEPLGAWASDCGVTYANGTPLVTVAADPAEGQYTVAAGVYTFNAADEGKGVLLSYGYIPADLANAALEWIADRIAYKARVGVSSKSLGGAETVSFIVKNMPDYVAGLLQPYMRVTPT